MQFLSSLRESRGPSIIGSSIEPIGPSRRGRGNSSLSLEMKSELFCKCLAMELAPLPTPGLFPVPTVHLAFSRVTSHREFHLGEDSHVYGDAEWLPPLP